MTVIDALLEQTRVAHEWANKLIDSVPFEHWNDTPNTIESNISWQVGHLIISEYYHAIMVITGFDEEITTKIDLREHNQKYGYESIPQEQVEVADPKLLKEQLLFMQSKVMKNIGSLALEDLECNVEQPVKQKHPVAITKFDAISWNIKHTMWHCGQIATLKRLINGGFDFGLPKRK